MTLTSIVFGYLGKGSGESRFSEQISVILSIGSLDSLFAHTSSMYLSFSQKRSSLAAIYASWFSLLAFILWVSFSSAILLKLFFSSVAFWSTSFSCCHFSASCFKTSALWDLFFSSAAFDFFQISSRERSFFLGGERGNSGMSSFGWGLRINPKAWPESCFSSFFPGVSEAATVNSRQETGSGFYRSQC